MLEDAADVEGGGRMDDDLCAVDGRKAESLKGLRGSASSVRGRTGEGASRNTSDQRGCAHST